MSNKIIRSICYFTKNPSAETVNKLDEIAQQLIAADYEIQIKRICSSGVSANELNEKISDKDLLLCLGSVGLDDAVKSLTDKRINFNLDLTDQEINDEHVEILFYLIGQNPEKTFEFTYVFNNAVSSPFFPAATYEKEGFAIGLQATDLAENCNSLDEWFTKMKEAWDEINLIFENAEDFLGIDSSIAPFSNGKSSLVNFVKKLGYDFNDSVVTDIYTKITDFIKKANPKPTGLCGLMLPCLEDFELAGEYEKGNFTIERNLFLSLHSGLGIDTYPIGVDENKDKVLNILKLVQALSNKYKKPLSVRFVSDGKAKIGEKTDFKNQYLKDVIVEKL